MRAPPYPADEIARLDTLYRCEILDTPPEPSFDGLVDLAAAICVTPIALVTLIDPTRQWFKSKIGLSVSETSRDIAFCAHTILGREVFIVEDANTDLRFADNPLVMGDPHIRFYAGVPIVLSDGTALGTVAVIDTVSRRLSAKQTSLLTKLAGQAAALLESRKEMKSFERGRRLPGQHLHYVDLGFRVAMWEWELSTGRLAWTPHLEEVYGVAIGSVRYYEDWRRLVHPEDLARVELERDEAVRNHQPFDLEFRIVKPKGDIRWVASRGSAKYDESGNPVLVMGNTHDITALKEMGKALWASRWQLQTIVEGTSDAMFIKDLQGRYLLFNGAAGRLVGKNPNHVLGHDDTAIFPSSQAERVMAQDQVVMAGRKTLTFEEGPLDTANGKGRFFLSTKGPFCDDEGTVIGLFGIARDITDRTRAEKALRESEERFRNIFEHAGTGIAITDLEGRFLRCNPAYCALLGYTEAELQGLNFKQVVHPADLAANLVEADRLRAQEVPSFEIENRSRHKDGHDVWVHKFVSLLRDDSGQPTAMFTLVTDITERRRAQELLEQRVAERTEELRVSEVFNREVLDSLSAHVAVLDATGLIVAVNRVWEKAALVNNPSGLAQVSLGANYVKVCERAADESSEARKTLQGILDVLEGRAQVFETEYVCVWPGHHQWFSMRVTPLGDRGGCVVVHEDVTDRKRAEQALRESEERLRLALDGADMGSWDVDLNTGAAIWNQRHTALHGYEAHDQLHTMQKWQDRVHPDDLERTLAAAEQAKRNQTPFIVEHRVCLPQSDELRWVSLYGRFRYDEMGTAIRFSGISLDITERKLMEQALRESEERLRLAQAAGKIGTFDWDIVGGKVTWSPQLEHLWGLPTGGFGGTNADWARQVHPEDIPEAERLTQRALMDPDHPYEYDHRIIRPDGSERWISARATIVRDETGRPLRMVGINMDITDRKQAEEKFRNLLEGAPDALVIVDTDGRMTLVNQQAERIFGYSRVELLDQPIDMLLPERFRTQHAGHRAGFVADPRVRPMGSGLDLCARHRDGHEFPVEISLSPLETESGRLVIAAFRDITDRKAAYTALQQAHQRLQTLSREVGLAEERVRGALSRELHDEFGQLLSAMKYDTKTLGSSLARRRVLTEATKKRVAAITQTVDRLFDSLHTMVRGLRPAVLEKLGLVPALENLLEDIQARFRLVCRLVADGFAEPAPFGVELEATLYRMTQELLTNVTRHAKASHVTIRLTPQEHAVELTVEDDGVGFASSSSSSDRYGLRGIRERAEVLGGTVAIRSQPGEGTIVTVRIPLREHEPNATGLDAFHAIPPGPAGQETPI